MRIQTPRSLRERVNGGGEGGTVFSVVLVFELCYADEDTRVPASLANRLLPACSVLALWERGENKLKKGGEDEKARITITSPISLQTLSKSKTALYINIGLQD